MPRNQKLSVLLRDLASLLQEEAARNIEFAARLDALLNSVDSRVKPRRGGRKTVSPQIPDVLSALEEKGEEEFRFWLRSFDLPTLKAITRINGFDAARASQKWSDPDKFIKLIGTQASARLRRGSAFLPQPRPTEHKEEIDIFRPNELEAGGLRPPIRDMRPFPESLEAIKRGCTCAIARGADGRPLRGSEGAPLYEIGKRCPVHG
jgi:hypothetical protein